jgi:RNA polymerase sigma-70 factor (ECF subfamily)
MFDRMYAYAYRLTGQHCDAEDVVQTVCVRATANADKVLAAASSEAYVIRIVRNEAMRLMSQNAKQHVSEFKSDVEDERLDSFDAVDQSDTIQTALACLTLEHRAIVLAYYFEDQTYQEIADQFSIPIGTVMSRLSRAKSMLRDCLKESVEKCDL